MIRNSTPADAKAIARVHVSSWQHAYRGLIPDDYLNSLESQLPQRELKWARAIEANKEDTLVAEVAGQIVGWISVGASREDDAVAAVDGEVWAIYVLAEHWNTGVGLALWKAGVQCLMDQGYRRLTLWVLSGNDRAIQFYRKAGWAELSGTQRTFVIDGVTLEEVRYGWPNAGKLEQD
jgi:ribosomal protein S18 acetylase RimI-like enzyme